MTGTVYYVEVLTFVVDQWEWRRIRPTGGQPYKFLTLDEALDVKRGYYRDHGDRVRVVECDPTKSAPIVVG